MVRVGLTVVGGVVGVVIVWLVVLMCVFVSWVVFLSLGRLVVLESRASWETLRCV